MGRQIRKEKEQVSRESREERHEREAKYTNKISFLVKFFSLCYMDRVISHLLSCSYRKEK